jgi:hypothetical protein
MYTWLFRLRHRSGRPRGQHPAMRRSAIEGVGVLVDDVADERRQRRIEQRRRPEGTVDIWKVQLSEARLSVPHFSEVRHSLSYLSEVGLKVPHLSEVGLKVPQLSEVGLE